MARDLLAARRSLSTGDAVAVRIKDRCLAHTPRQNLDISVRYSIACQPRDPGVEVLDNQRDKRITGALGVMRDRRHGSCRR